MKLPSQKNLESVYQKLLHLKPNAPTVTELARYSQWARMDPRLGEIWVGYVRKHWKTINPSDLRMALCKEDWPSAAAVLLEFVGKQTDSKALPYWCKIVTEGFRPAGASQFFVGLRRLGGEAMLEDALHSTNEYRKWGYLARENLLRTPANSQAAKSQRDAILLALLAKHSRIKTSQYWEAIGKCVSKRQAERDLKAHPQLRAHGKTKGKLFSRV